METRRGLKARTIRPGLSLNFAAGLAEGREHQDARVFFNHVWPLWSIAMTGLFKSALQQNP